MILLHRALHKDFRTSRFAILRIYTECQSSPQEIIKKSLEHYSTESMAIQITPWAFSNSNPRSLAGSERGGGGLTGESGV